MLSFHLFVYLAGDTQTAVGEAIPEDVSASELPTGEDNLSDFSLGIVGPNPGEKIQQHACI